MNGQQEPPAVTEAHTFAQNEDGQYLSPYRNGGSRSAIATTSRSGSENDSLLDLYGQPISAAESMERRERTPPQPPLPQPYSEPLYKFEGEDPDGSRWIHRDKLAEIEKNELQEAGIKLPRQSSLRSRSNSRSRGRKSHSRGPSRDLPVSNGQVQPYESLPSHDSKRQRTRSPQKQQLEEDDPAPLEPADFDLRTPEEIADDPLANQMYRQQGLRSSSSRIPLPTSSPMPIPQEHRERHTPLPRTRGASGNWPSCDEDGIGYNRLRLRSQSVGSQVLLDDGDSVNITSTPNAVADLKNASPSSSPSKRVTNTKTVPSAHARKASATLRNVSGSQKAASPATRPKSRSGLEPRPATAINRPEGEAPWVADMDQPDPRLPPDQQLIPTHAKRLQQKQLEEQANGLTPPKREFSPVAVHTQNGLQLPSPAVTRSLRDLNEKSPAENQAGWPLKVSPKPSMNNVNGSTGGNAGNISPNGASDHGGYRTIPKVQNPPPVAASPKPDSQPIRREIEEKVRENDKGCGCCVIM